MATEVIGRRAELETGRAFLDSLGAGPATLRIEGEAGIGKTALFDALVTEAERRGWRTLRVRATEAEVDLAFAGLDQLLAGLPATAFAGLAPPLRRAIDIALLRTDPGIGGADFRAVGVALAGAFEALSRDSPVVIAIDDRQWLDPASARVLEVASRRFGPRPIGIIETRRSDHGGADPAGSHDHDPSTTIHLAGLSLAALRSLVEARTGVALGRSSLTRLEAVSAGNPFLALEIVGYLQRRGREIRVDELVPVPGDVGRLVADRLGGLEAETRSVLEFAAALGRPDIERLSRVVRPEALEQAVRRAADAGLARLDGTTLLFAHPLFASAVYATTGESRRHEIHRALAEHLRDPVESALHLALASALPDAAVADRVDQAAHVAGARGAPDVAARLFEHARRLTPSDDVAAASARTIALSRVLWEIGDVGRSVDLAIEAEASLPPGPVRAAVRLLRARQLSWTASPVEAVAMCAAALPDAADDPILGARLHLRSAYALDGNLPAAAGHVAAARALLAGSDPSSVRELWADSTLFDVEIRLRRGIPVAPEELAAALQLVRSLPEADVRPQEADIGGLAREREWLILERLDDIVGARDALADMLRRDEALGRDRSGVIAHADLAELEGWLGDVEAARAHADTAAELAEQTGRTPHAIAFVAVARAAVALHVGDLAGASAAIASDLSTRAEPADEIADRLRAMRGSVAFRAGEFRAALEDFDAVSAAFAVAGLGHPSMYRYRGDAIEALIMAGDLDAARLAVDRFETAGSGLRSPWMAVVTARSRAMLAGAAGDSDGALDQLAEALLAHANLMMPVELGRTQLLLGQIRRRRREKRLADEALRAALATFERAGADGWAARARTELGRVGLRPRAPATLTPTEAQVARLAAAGRTNREVADAAFLSPKTVDGVLARVYAKLGIRSRAELGARIAAGEAGLVSDSEPASDGTSGRDIRAD